MDILSSCRSYTSVRAAGEPVLPAVWQSISVSCLGNGETVHNEQGPCHAAPVCVASRCGSGAIPRRPAGAACAHTEHAATDGELRLNMY